MTDLQSDGEILSLPPRDARGPRKDVKGILLRVRHYSRNFQAQQRLSFEIKESNAATIVLVVVIVRKVWKKHWWGHSIEFWN